MNPAVFIVIVVSTLFICCPCLIRCLSSIHSHCCINSYPYCDIIKLSEFILLWYEQLRIYVLLDAKVSDIVGIMKNDITRKMISSDIQGGEPKFSQVLILLF